MAPLKVIADNLEMFACNLEKDRADPILVKNQ